jgi:hypothetical protein
MTRALIRISPQLVGNPRRCRSSFTIVGIDDDERTLEIEKDSGHHVSIPIWRILEVLPAPAMHKHAALVINGRGEWFQRRDGGGWYFVE